MTTAASAIAYRVGVLLNDTESVRWTIQELTTWINDGQREIATYRPDATSAYVECTLATGVRQSLDTIAEASVLKPIKLLDIVRNTGSSSLLKVVRQVEREILDNTLPTWPSAPGSVNIEHFMFDPRAPRIFYVYPPAATGAKVELLLSRYPTDIVTPVVDGGTYTSISGDLDIPDIYTNALVDYVCFRAFMKDAEVAETAARAGSFYQSFTSAMGVEGQATAAAGPKTAT